MTEARGADGAEHEPDAIPDEAARLAIELIDRISHDLRTPIGSMLIWLKLLRQEPVGGTDASTALGMIERSAVDLVRQVDDLDETRRAISGDLRSEPEVVDFAGIVRAAAEQLADDAEGRGASIAMLPLAAAAAITADPRRLRQAFDRLLQGLVREAPRGARIEVRVDASEGQVQCIIAIVRPMQVAVVPAPSRSAGLHAKLARRLIELQGGRVQRGGADETITVRFPHAAVAPESVAADVTSRGTR